MIIFLKNYFASLIFLGLFDFIWLGLIMKSFNNQQLQGIARFQNGQMDPLKIPALLTYLLMALIVTVFALPKVGGESLPMSFAYGALLGLCAYGIFDLTNLSIMKDYPQTFALVDITWGTFLFGLTTLAYRFWSGFLDSQIV